MRITTLALVCICMSTAALAEDVRPLRRDVMRPPEIACTLAKDIGNDLRARIKCWDWTLIEADVDARWLGLGEGTRVYCTEIGPKMETVGTGSPRKERAWDCWVYGKPD